MADEAGEARMAKTTKATLKARQPGEEMAGRENERERERGTGRRETENIQRQWGSTVSFSLEEPKRSDVREGI